MTDDESISSKPNVRFWATVEVKPSISKNHEFHAKVYYGSRRINIVIDSINLASLFASGYASLKDVNVLFESFNPQGIYSLSFDREELEAALDEYGEIWSKFDKEKYSG